MKKLLISLSVIYASTCSQTVFAEDSKSGGQSGFDASIQAISPSIKNIGISLAGATPVDISRYVLAANNGASNGQIAPDGEQLAFRWSITGRPQLWIMPTQGGQPKQLTYGNGISFFRWAPDGQSLIYGADNDSNEQEAYYRITADGNKETLLLPAKAGAFRRFGGFIDNDNITFTSTERTGLDFDVYVANTITQQSNLVYEGKYGFSVNAISPNGRYLVISETVGEDSDNLYLFDTKSTKIKVISKPKRRANHTDAGIAWRSDSSGFYLASNLDRNFTAPMFYKLDEGLSTLNESSVDLEQVKLCGKQSEFLVYAENNGGYSNLKIQNINTSKFKEAPDLPEGVYSISCSENSNEMAITINGWSSPGDIYTWNIVSGKLVNSFKAQLAGINKETLVKPNSIKMPARDGVMLQGLLYMPTTDIAGNKPPVVFRVHGGPTAQSRPSFRATAQYLVARGIAVFLPNVRGSTGFGHEYSSLDDRENRLDSIRDLVDMLSFLESEGKLDTNRAAVVGGSYGGYAVNAVLANFPGHFKAGASLFGVADWVTALKVASPALKASDRIEYGDINEQKWLDFYTKQSPIRQADQINVPVLFSHGVMDPRIDISESEVMVKTLRKNGIDAPFIRFLDEGHGWRKLENQLFYAREEAKFLEKQFGLSSK